MDSDAPAVEPKIDTRFHKTFRIAVSGDVRLTKLEVDIIDTRAFQRLRRIKQLGPSCWVYPTAVHTRFDHSIGVLHTVDTMVGLIREVRDQVDAKTLPGVAESHWITDRQRILARLYGLLHDITHVPFGHTLEDELGIFASHDAFQKGPKADEGMDRFEEFLGPESDIGKLIIGQLGRNMYDRFRNIYLRGKFDRLEVVDDDTTTADEFVYYLVSDTVCADLLDYLQRDNYFCDLELRTPTRVLKYLYVTDIALKGSPPEEPPRRRVVIRLWKPRKKTARRDVMTDLAGLLDSRYMLAERVYFHPAKIIVGTMIGRAALEAKLSGDLRPESLWWLGDDSLLDLLIELDTKEDGDIGDARRLTSRLASAVVDRELYARIGRYTREKFSTGGADEGPYKAVLKAFRTATGRRHNEDEIAQIAGVRAGDVLIYVGPEDMNLKVAKAMVDWQGDRMPMGEMTDEPILMSRLAAIQESHRRLWSVDLIVHPDLTDAEKRIVALAFEAKFLARAEAVRCWDLLLKGTVAKNPAFSNRSHDEIASACENAANDLAANQIAAHGRKPLELMADTVNKYLSQ